MSQGSKSVFDVSIAGIPLKLKSGHSPEMVKKLVSVVDKKVREALPATKIGSVQNAALLAALNLAEELFELKRKAAIQLEKFERKTQRALHELENSASNTEVSLDN